MEEIPKKISAELDDEDEEVEEPRILYEGAYNAADYANLSVNNEIQQIFQHIGFYTPQIVDIELRLRPFIPDYIPAVGDIDSFVKIPRPDGQEDNLGLVVLDEPSAKHQSDPSLLNLKLRSMLKIGPTGSVSSTVQESIHDQTVRVAKDAKDVQNWINSISSIHESQAYNSSNMLQLISSNSKMPEIERLMQELPSKVEQLINSNEIMLPDKDLDCSLEEFISIICVSLDIPVHNSKIASLHTLFSLYNEFQNSQHFKSDQE